MPSEHCYPFAGIEALRLTVPWKDLELRVAKAWGGTRSGPVGKMGPDVSGVPLAIQIKRSSRETGGVRGSWIEQAKRDGKTLELPWILVVGQPHKRPVAVVDHDWLVLLWKERQSFAAAVMKRAANTEPEGGEDASPPV